MAGSVASSAFWASPASGLGDIDPPFAGEIAVATSDASGPWTSEVPIEIISHAAAGFKATSFLDLYYYRIWIIASEIDFEGITTTKTENVEVWNSFFETRSFGLINETGDEDEDPGIVVAGPQSGSFVYLQSRMYVVTALLEGAFHVDVTFDWVFTGGGDTFSVLHVVGNRVIPIEVRLIPDSMPNYFLPVKIDSSIGDEEVDLEMWDADEVISQLLVDHGEGVKCELLYWFPQVELLLPIWQGHLRNEDEASVDTIKLKAVQGFRSADANVPSRAHYRNCMAIFGGLFDNQAEIDAHDCPYNKHIGGGVGNNDPDTGLPWTFCNRQGLQSCTDRGVNPLFHLSHNTIETSAYNNQPGGGPRLLITSGGNENNLKEPVRVVMGRRRVSGMQVLVFSVPTIAEEGWFFAIYEVGEGPMQSFANAAFSVSGVDQAAIPLHYNQRLGTKGQTAVGADLTPHSYSSTGLIRYNFGYVDTSTQTLGPGSASASALVEGLNNIRVYTDPDTYTEIFTSNRAWQIARILCDQRWGFGYDYDRLNIENWIEAAAWCPVTVNFVDPFGDEWPHVRSDSHPELISKKVQQQIEDICMAGRLSRPFLFNGKIHIMPLRALTEEELAECPVFTDEGEDRNIVWDDEKTTLTISRKSDLDLVNRVECTFDDGTNDYLETPLNPVEDINAQLAAGRVVGDKARKINPKKYPLLGVVVKNQAIKMAWSLLDLGPHDEGGLRNNLKLKFKIWFMDSLDLHVDKVVRVNSSRLTKYGFDYFRVKNMERGDDLQVELTLQAYNKDYMDAFEAGIDPPEPEDCEEGYHWDPILLACVLDPPEPTPIPDVLLSTTVVDCSIGTKQALYTVPGGNQAVITRQIWKLASGDLSAMADDADSGFDSLASDWNNPVTPTDFDTLVDNMAVLEHVKDDLTDAALGDPAEVFGVIFNDTAIVQTVTIEVYGYLIPLMD